MNMNKKNGDVRGQISTEYLIVIGFILFIVMGILSLAFFYVNNISDRIRMEQVQNYANKIISSAENVFYSGEPSRVRINVYMPSGVTGVEPNGYYLFMNVTTNSGLNLISFKSRVPLNGSLTPSEGLKQINVEAKVDRVELSEKQ